MSCPRFFFFRSAVRLFFRSAGVTSQAFSFKGVGSTRQRGDLMGVRVDRLGRNAFYCGWVRNPAPVDGKHPMMP